MRCSGRSGGLECRYVRRIKAIEGPLERQPLISRPREVSYDRKAEAHTKKNREGCCLYGDYRRLLSSCSRCFESASEENGAETARPDDTRRESAICLTNPRPARRNSRWINSDNIALGNFPLSLPNPLG